MTCYFTALRVFGNKQTVVAGRAPHGIRVPDPQQMPSPGQFIPYCAETAKPAAPAKPAEPGGLLARLNAFACRGFLTLTGWRREGDWPVHDKAVILAAPHTSNWDGIYMLAAAGAWQIKLNWMGKKSLTQGPFGGFVRRLGCVPVDREARNDLVHQMVDAFASSDHLMLAISPEGTRAKTAGWKSGFYNIAVGAGVPIICSVLDYGSKRVRLAGEFIPSGNYQADLPLIQAIYADAQGLRKSTTAS